VQFKGSASLETRVDIGLERRLALETQVCREHLSQQGSELNEVGTALFLQARYLVFGEVTSRGSFNQSQAESLLGFCFLHIEESRKKRGDAIIAKIIAEHDPAVGIGGLSMLRIEAEVVQYIVEVAFRAALWARRGPFVPRGATAEQASNQQDDGAIAYLCKRKSPCTGNRVHLSAPL